IVVGGGLFGFAGMLIGVPTFAVIYGLISENMDKNLRIKKIAADKENLQIAADEAVDSNEGSL
ncbi:MAG: AI-2E family transporter, partial [Oscillospiraceae bacterium]